MGKLIGKVVLRNAYQVRMDSEGDYKVAHKDARGAEYVQDVAARVVAYVKKQLAGKTVTVADAKSLLDDAPPSLGLPYLYGYKLHFYSQSVLIVLVATRQATYAKCGQRYDYTVLARNTPKAQSTQRKQSGTRSSATR
jgi:hypothetical protein